MSVFRARLFLVFLKLGMFTVGERGGSELIPPKAVDGLVEIGEVLLHRDRWCQVRGGHCDNRIDRTTAVIGEGEHGAGHDATHRVPYHDDRGGPVHLKVLKQV